MEIFNRNKIIIGDIGQEKLTNSNILIVGVGGVGGYVLELLARAGVGHITIVDFDEIDETNINRQIIALSSNIHTKKVEAFAKRILDINPQIKLETYASRLTEDNVDKILDEKFDYVVDAIDDVKNKVLLIEKAHEKCLKIVSALGSGNRVKIPVFEVVDIYQTQNDGLAKAVRTKLREDGVKKHNVVYSKQDRISSNSNNIGSISYYPAMCGAVIAGFVINELLEEI